MNCSQCRFYASGKCVKFSIVVNEDYKPCNDFAEKATLNETVQKIQLND